MAVATLGLSVAGMAMSALSMGLGISANNASARAEFDAITFAEKERAQITNRLAKRETARHRARAATLGATQRVAIAKSNLTLDSPTALQLASKTFMDGERDAGMASWQIRMQGYSDQLAGQRVLAEAEARNLQIGLEGGAQILRGAGNIFETYAGGAAKITPDFDSDPAHFYNWGRGG